MGKYKYRIMNSEGEKLNGTYEADSKEEVIDYISGNGYYPLLVEESAERKNVQLKFNDKVRIKDISIFCRQFYTMLDAGVPILTCLKILSEQVVNTKLKQAVTEVSEDVEKGALLSDAMKKRKDVFPDLLTSLVTSGEASGSLDSVMLRMSENYEKENKINNKVRSAMIYPIVLSFVAVAAVVFILVYVMPTFVEVFDGTGAQLPWTTKLLLAMSTGIKNNWLMLLGLIFISAFGINMYSKTDQGVLFFSKLKLKFPVIKNVTQMITVSRFTRTLSILISSGLSLIDALQIVSQVVGNKIVESSLIRIKDNVMRGDSLYVSLRDSNIFPPMLYSMVKIGEETGSLEGILNKTADFYDEELDSTIQKAVSFLEPALIVVMGLAIGFIVVSIMIPMFDVYGQI